MESDALLRHEQNDADVFEELIERQLARLGELPSMRLPFQHGGTSKRSLDSALIADAAGRLELRVVPLSDEILVLSDGTTSVGFYQNMAWTLSSLDRLTTNDKSLTKRILSSQGLPVPRGEVVDSVAAAVDCYRRIGPPVVVKPISGSGGRGVVVNIRTEQELMAAVQGALARKPLSLIEESIPSIDLRVMVVAGRTAAAMLRVPAHVQGDGTSTIAELVEAKNRLRAANTYLRHVPIRITGLIGSRLAERGLRMDSVIEAGRRVYFHYKANLGSGGDSIDVTDLVHPDILRLAERATTSFGSVVHAGVDILTQRLDQPPNEQHCVICEVNCNNDMPIHVFPLFGKSIDTGRLELEGYFPSAPVRRRWIGAGPVGRTTIARPMRDRLAGGDPQPWPRVPVTEAVGELADQNWHPLDVAAGSRSPSSPRRLDGVWLRQALATRGWKGVRSDGRIIRARHRGRELVLERSGSSVFAVAVAKSRGPLQTLLDKTGLPSCKSRTFKPDQWPAAKKFFESAPGPWNLRPVGDQRSELARYSFRQESTFERAWARLSTRSLPALLEQAPQLMAVRLLLIGDRVAGTLLQIPMSVIGDGITSVAGLLERKVAARSLHPYLRHTRIRQAVLSPGNLRSHKLEPETVLEPGRRVRLSRSPLIEAGAETVGLPASPSPELERLARTVVDLLGNPPIASVTFAARPADQDCPFPHWAVTGVDPDPVIALFAWPWAGESAPDRLYRAAARVLRSGQRYELPVDG
jgi:D-alanine-D-alanine ligase-like ATP-grasp enzyme